jgi:penicillin-binding protein 2
MANLAAILANQGYYYPPHLIRSIEGQSIQNRYLIKKQVRIDDQHYKPVLDGMERAVSSGTAGRAAVNGVRVCGKTGTSQNPHGKDHSVFFAFAPRENPEIALAVYVENAGFGGDIAAPIAGLLIEKYLKDEISPYKKQMEENLKSRILIEQ